MEGQSYTKREIPMIAGSSAAFIAIIAILVVVIIVSCTAVAYILREEMAHFRHGEQTHTHQSRDRYRTSRKPAIFGPLARVLGVSGSRQPTEITRGDKSRGWMQAGNESEWDLESPAGEGEELDQYGQNHTASTPMRMARQGSAVSAQSSNADSLAPSSRIYVPGSDYELQGGRGYSYSEPSSPPRHGVVPSTQSQPSSPPSSLSSPLARHPTTLTSSESLERLSNNDSTTNMNTTNPFVEVPSTITKTFSSGSKFVEGF